MRWLSIHPLDVDGFDACALKVFRIVDGEVEAQPGADGHAGLARFDDHFDEGLDAVASEAGGLKLFDAPVLDAVHT
jgi:hypothetical protein